MKTFSEKLQLRVVNYNTDYKYYENDRLRTDWLLELGKTNIEENESELNNFLGTCLEILDTHAPRKQKWARGDHMPFMNFMNKTLSKEIILPMALEYYKKLLLKHFTERFIFALFPEFVYNVLSKIVYLNFFLQHSQDKTSTLKCLPPAWHFEKRLQHRGFPDTFEKNFKKTFFIELHWVTAFKCHFQGTIQQSLKTIKK